MVKSHNCLIKIKNNSGMDMNFQEHYFYTGRIADGFEFPLVIRDGNDTNVLCYERNYALIAGCSAYVTYKMGTSDITIAFSNPLVGWNKLGVGVDGSTVWDEMNDHDYKSFNVFLSVSDRQLVFRCKCTGGPTNTCTVEIESAES